MGLIGDPFFSKMKELSLLELLGFFSDVPGLHANCPPLIVWFSGLVLWLIFDSNATGCLSLSQELSS